MREIQTWDGIVHKLPCPVHPGELSGTVGDRTRCAACKRQQRRAKYRAKGESVRALFSTARNLARRRGLEWKLTIHQWLHLVTSPCVYTIHSTINPDIHVGIDRRDSSLGYTVENSQPCCARHNLMKSDIFTHEQAQTIAQTYRIECGNQRQHAHHQVPPVLRCTA